MGEVARDLANEIKQIEETIKTYRGEGRGERERLMSIALTHLETARLFLRESQSL